MNNFQETTLRKTTPAPHSPNVDRTAVNAMLKAHGAEKHGPNIEHVSISENDFWRFINEYTNKVIEENQCG